MLLAVALSAVAAYAGGGASIALAPDLRWEERYAGGGRPGGTTQFFHIPLEAGDVSHLQYEPLGRGSVILELYPPETTDATLPVINPEGRTSSSAPDTMRLAPSRRSGRWVLRVRTTPGAGYALTGFVVRFVTARMTGPARVQAGSRAFVRGTVSRVESGSVSIQRRVGRRWTAVGAAAIRSQAFRFRAAFSTSGTYLLRAVYRGDRSHRAAVSNVLRIRAS